jgi:hypothetical protein
MTLTQRLMGDPDPKRVEKSEALKARLGPPRSLPNNRPGNPDAAWRMRA